MKRSLETLEPLRDAVHVWLLPSDRPLSPKLIVEYRDLLSRDEADHYSRFRASRPRRQFLLGRALARTTLSRYAKITPEKWIFRANSHGRPEIAGPAGFGDLRFNLSHTGGLVACLSDLIPPSVGVFHLAVLCSIGGACWSVWLVRVHEVHKRLPEGLLYKFMGGLGGDTPSSHECR